MTIDALIATAAKWWADTLRISRMASAMSCAGLLTDGGITAQAAAARRMTAEEIDEFEQVLAKLMTGGVGDIPTVKEELGRGGCFSISVDYDPCPLLREAAGRTFGSRLDPPFPEKTRMHIYKDKITVACGYGAPYERI